MEDGLFLMKRYAESDEEIQSKHEKPQKANFSICSNKGSTSDYKLPKKCEKEDHLEIMKKRKHYLDEGELNKSSTSDYELSQISKKENHVAIKKEDKLYPNVEEKPVSNREKNNLLVNQNSETDNTEHKRKKKKQKLDTSTSKQTTITQVVSSEKNSNNNNSISTGKENKTERNFAEKVNNGLPNWLNKPTQISINLHENTTPISELRFFDKTVVENLNTAGIEYLFPVQMAVIPWLMQMNQSSLIMRPSDLCVSAPTGSGKTLAYVLPIVQSLKERVICAVRALVVLPVNELAMQVYEVFEKFVLGTDLKVVLLTGKKSFTAEQKSLMKSNTRQPVCLADIIVTTPGRILDHIHKTEGFSLELVRYLVIDEADRMMDEIQKGWLKQIEDAVYKNMQSPQCPCFLPSCKRVKHFPTTACSKGHINLPLQKLLYSATLTHDPEKLNSLALYQPKLFASTQDFKESQTICNIPANLKVKSITCTRDIKPMVLCDFIIKGGFKKVLCFAETVERAERLSGILSKMNLIVVREISSNLSAVQRKIIFKQFKNGGIRLLICSDIVSRGIDFKGVDCVISYDLPPLIKTYIHRIGRTARAGKEGTALMLLSEEENLRFDKLLKSESLPQPTELELNLADLEKYVDSFQNALLAASSDKPRQTKASKNSGKMNN